ncbi:MAG TPA: hypothetical protein VN455_07085, partial [Methanotrichaceae archaeon]|nr:hypothetical protein [Methanotrichaceae archaeon]
KFEYLLAEVESPYLDRDPIKMMRVDYYRGLGMKELKGIRYMLPPYHGTSPMEMILMVLPKRGEDYLDGSTIRDVIVRIFRELHDRDTDDPLLASIIKGMPDKISMI